MNKMNIPAPFRMALPTPPLPPPVMAPPPPPLPPEKPRTADLSSDESEIESSDVQFLFLSWLYDWVLFVTALFLEMELSKHVNYISHISSRKFENKRVCLEVSLLDL